VEYKRSDLEVMLPVTQAENLILELVSVPIAVEEVELTAATGRILATTIESRLDFPPWDNSAMDGYAVLSADIQSAGADCPVTLEIIEDIPAGTQPQQEIVAGTAARIFTGGVMPAGADTIVMQEDSQREGNLVKICQPSQPGTFVRHRGEYARSGDSLLAPGTRLNPPEIAILAATGCHRIGVYPRPQVAILSTGDELVTPDAPLQPGQIFDSNQYALAAFVRQAGGIPIPLGIVPDDRAKLTAAMANAIASADLVLSTGGVSVGDYDYVEAILAELGGEIRIRSVAVKPGKPLTVAKFDRDRRSVVYFGLPGNPVSALVSCWRFVQPALNKLSGLPPSNWTPHWHTAIVTQDLKSDGKRESYLWGRLALVEGQYRFTLSSGSHSSGNLINLASTNALAVLPIGTTSLRAGESVTVLVISG
jgi:molybdopterin molybdotransferase